MDPGNDEDTNKIAYDISVTNLVHFGGVNMVEMGEKVYRSGHVVQVGVVSTELNSSNIEAFCLQSSNPNQTHTINIKTSDNFENWDFKCSCKAGLGGKCKHIYAVLIHIHENKELDLITCTQRKQTWGQVAKTVAGEVLKPSLARDLEEVSTFEIKEYRLTDERYDFFKSVMFTDPKSHIRIFLDRHQNWKHPSSPSPQRKCRILDTDDIESKHFLLKLFNNSKFNSQICTVVQFTPELLKFYSKRICTTQEEAINLNLKSKDRKCMLWKYERKLRITDSESYRLFTASQNPKTDWEEVITKNFAEKLSSTQFQIVRIEENNAIRLYESKNNLKVIKLGLVVHPTCPWIACSPIGFCSERNCVVEVMIFMNEKKLDFEKAIKKVRFLKFSDGRYSLNSDSSYYVQTQMNMHFLKCTNCDFIIYDYQSKNYIIVEVTLNSTFVEKLIIELYSLYFNRILRFCFENHISGFDQKKYV